MHKKLRIGIDGRNLISPLSGINRYILEMGRGLADRGHHVYLYLPASPHPTIPCLSWATTRKENANSAAERIIWGQSKLALQALHDKVDILWGPAHRLPFRKIRGVKKVLTVHDLVWQKAPETMARKTYWGERLLMARSVKAADIVIADSESTKFDLIEMMPQISSKVTTIYPGVDESFFGEKIRPELIPMNKRYFLFVGTVEPRKNLKRLLLAWSKMSPDIRSDFILVVAGKPGWGGENVSDTISLLGIQNSVLLTGFVSEVQLRNLYFHAEALFMPSLYEGFGLPLLEAQASGTPVLTSTVSSMPEISGPDAVLVDPTDEYSMQNGVEAILLRGGKSHDISRRSISFAKSYSWEKSIEKLESTFSSALQL